MYEQFVEVHHVGIRATSSHNTDMFTLQTKFVVAYRRLADVLNLAPVLDTLTQISANGSLKHLHHERK